jgi:HPr kinase/phosphorylase
MRTSPIKQQENISVPFLVDKLQTKLGIQLEVLTDVGANERLITDKMLHRPGLALAGFVELFTYHRVQIVGNTESRYLQHLSANKRREAFEYLIRFDIPCLFITDNNTLDAELVELAREKAIPIFRTPTPTTRFAALVHDFLDDQFAEQVTIHGALVDVYGIGLLITGKSGIGKSEVALDLVERGHRLVADDVIVATKKGENVLIGAGTDLVQHFIEIRGLGLLDIRAMFGVRSVRFQKRIELVVQIEVWDEDAAYERVGTDDNYIGIMEVKIPHIKLPITPGKNITVICETIAMNHLLKHYGYDAADVFQKRLAEKIQKKQKGISRGTDYFEHDYE